MTISRRETFLGATALLASRTALAKTTDGEASRKESRLAALKRLHYGRLGVAILDRGNGKRLARRVR